jgi:hypothetical protein
MSAHDYYSDLRGKGEVVHVRERVESVTTSAPSRRSKISKLTLLWIGTAT